MKILKIKIRNITSLKGSNEIDFTARPLREAGLFVISGETGAGKSSILDALCLALYGRVPRMESTADTGRGKAPDGTLGEEREPGVRDCRNLLSRGEWQAEVFADFEVSRGRFRAGWGVRRAYKKAAGKLQAVTRTLLRKTDTGEEWEPYGDQTVTAVNNAILELSGLRFEEFTRAVLLAQGDFAGFLRAGDKEKSDLLEKVTGTGIYARISKKIFERCREEENELKQVRSTIEGLQLPSPEQEAADLDLYDRQSAAVESLKTRLIQQQEFYNYLTRHLNLQRELTEARDLLDLAVRERESQCRDRADLAAYDNADDRLRAAFRERQQLQAALPDAERKLFEVQSGFSDYRQSWHAALRAAGTVRAAYERFISSRPAFDADMAAAVNLDKQVSEALGREKTLKADCETAQTVLSDRQMAHRRASEAFQKAEKDLQKAEAVEAGTAPYVYLQVSGEEIKLQCGRLAALDAKSARITDGLLKAGRERAGLVQKLQSVSKALDKLQEDLPAEVQILRARLRAGCPCPVCGQFVTHPPEGETARIRGKSVETIESERSELLLRQADLRQEIYNTDAEIASGHQLHRESAGEYTEIFENLRGLSGGLLRRDAGIDEVKRLQDEVAERLTVLADARAAVQNALTELKNAEIHLKNTSVATAEQTRLSRVVAAEVEKAEIESSRLRKARGSYFGGRCTEEVRKEAESEKDRYIDESGKAARVSDAAFDRVMACISSMRAARKEVRRAVEGIAEASDIIKVRSKDTGLSEEELVGLFGVFALRAAEVRKQIGITDHKISAAKGAAESLARQLAAHKAPEGFSCSVSIEESRRLRDQLQAEELEAQNLLSEIKYRIKSTGEKHDRLKLLREEEHRRRAVLLPWDKLNIDFGAAGGEKLRAVAQAETLGLLISYANVHLAEIAPRYRLATEDSSLSLYVEDRYDGGVRRSVNSLSGGESFLCSLALALGLSSALSSGQRLSHLFIDEGFGSLDSDSLDTAVSALERLQESGRSIGLISHVSELGERIPTAIRVEARGNGVSSVFTEMTGGVL